MSATARIAIPGMERCKHATPFLSLSPHSTQSCALCRILIHRVRLPFTQRAAPSQFPRARHSDAFSPGAGCFLTPRRSCSGTLRRFGLLRECVSVLRGDIPRIRRHMATTSSTTTTALPMCCIRVCGLWCRRRPALRLAAGRGSTAVTLAVMR